MIFFHSINSSNILSITSLLLCTSPIALPGRDPPACCSIQNMHSSHLSHQSVHGCRCIFRDFSAGSAHIFESQTRILEWRNIPATLIIKLLSSRNGATTMSGNGIYSPISADNTYRRGIL